MTRFRVTVVLPPGSVEDIPAIETSDALVRAMAFYDSNNEQAITEEWDYWGVGGPSLPLRPGALWRDVVGAAGVLPGPYGFAQPGRCAAGRIRALNLDKCRNDTAARAKADWNEYASIIRGTPVPQPWRSFVERVEQAERQVLGGLTHRESIDEIDARDEAGFVVGG